MTGDLTAPTFIGNLDGAVASGVKNGATTTLVKGTPVYQTSTSGNNAVVEAADASNAATMPAIGVLAQDLTAGQEVDNGLIHLGFIQGVDTSTFSEGDTIYVASGGGYTNTAPSGEGNSIQNLGKVLKVHASNGSGIVMGAGRSNATPNLNDGNVFIGNASNQAESRALAIADTTGLQTALDGKEPADATILKDADIGVTVLSPTGDGSGLTGINTDLVADTTPQLGGNLDLNNNNITGTGNIPAGNLSGALPAIDGSALTGVQPFPSGTKMVFAQASAPTGWTQDTTNNDKALRVVSGSGGGTGGTHGLSSPPSTSHTHTGPSHTHSTPNHSHSHTLSAGAHTLSTSQMPSHSHAIDAVRSGSGSYSDSTPYKNYYERYQYSAGTFYNASTGGGGSHSHSLSGSISSGGSGTSGSGGTGATSSAGPTAFAPQYVDVIVCSKD